MEENQKKRPLLLSVLLLFSFVYFFVLFLLFVIGSFYSGWITDAIHDYISSHPYSRSQVMIIFIAGALLHATAFAGAIMIWNLRRKGYFILSVSCLIIAVYQLFQHDIGLTTTAIYILLVVLF